MVYLHKTSQIATIARQFISLIICLLFKIWGRVPGSSISKANSHNDQILTPRPNDAQNGDFKPKWPTPCSVLGLGPWGLFFFWGWGVLHPIWCQTAILVSGVNFSKRTWPFFSWRNNCLFAIPWWLSLVPFSHCTWFSSTDLVMDRPS